MKKTLLIALLLVTGIAKMAAQKPGVVLSDKAGWHKIGETVVNFNSETDHILVVGANKFQALKIKVTESPILLESFDIHFTQGEKQSVTLGERIKSPGETRVVQLDGGGERVVNKVTFRYRTVDQMPEKGPG